MKIARAATPGKNTQFRKDKYGSSDIRSFLRDVLAMANAPVEGPRYIIVGADYDDLQRKSLHTIDEEDFSGKPSYQSLANEYIEPPLRIRYKPVSIEGKRIGVFEIGDCQDRPYMMRIDYSEKLRRGDAYIRTKDSALKMGRRQLAELFERKFRDSVSADDIEIGFPGEIIHKELQLNCCDLSQLPSAEASKKLDELFAVRNQSKKTGSTTVMARLTHARLFGADDPYVDRSPTALVKEMKELRHKYRDHDNHFLFESRAEHVQMVVYNQGQEPIVDASLSLIMPNHNAFYVAATLPKVPRDDGFADRTPDEIAAYPSVSLKDDSVQVTSKIGDIPIGEPIDVFVAPLRLCVGKDLGGKRFGIRYALHGQNLRSPAKGKLRLIFRK
ncbi:MAG: ATP-binding protein [Proteobacteria bacterium]|nr:ATP-binding protein [Pseudomonadota bacterium]